MRAISSSHRLSAFAALVILTMAGALLAATTARADAVTLLLRLETLKPDGRKWDVDRGADLVVCLAGGCAVSRGPATPARWSAGKRALGPLNALNLTGKAGACTNRAACILRGVELPDGAAVLQPIDLDLDRHDRLEVRQTAADPSCRLLNGELRCYRGVYTPTYSLWVVPEGVAEEAGPDGLVAALDTLLTAGRRTYAEDLLTEARDGLPELLADLYVRVVGFAPSPRCGRDVNLALATFGLTGSLDGRDIEVEDLLLDYLDPKDRFALAASIDTRPRAFWVLADAIGRLTALASADHLGDDAEPGDSELRLEDGDMGTVLVAGEPVRQRMAEILAECEGNITSGLAPPAPGGSG